MRKWTRRAFIGAGTIVGGGFVLGVADVAFAPTRHGVRMSDPASTGELNTWITVTPDNVVTVPPSAVEMGSVHERTARPLRCTVHAPHAEMPHPNLVPVRPSVSRIAQSSGVSGSRSIDRD